MPRDVELVALAGNRIVPGLRGLAGGPLDPVRGRRPTPRPSRRADERGEPAREREPAMTTLDRGRYAALYGPTAGDRIRLADTNLLIEVEEDRSAGPQPGDEVVFGGGKVIRESMGQSRATRAEGTPDTVITGAVVSTTGASSRPTSASATAGSSRSARPATPTPWTASHPDLVIGPGTEIIAGNGKILTAGAIDCHVHLICPTDPGQGAGRRHHHDHRRRHRPGRGHQGDHGHPGRLAPGPDARGDRPLPGQRAAARQGQHHVRGGDVGAAARRGRRLQAARGLGHHAGRDRRLPAGGRRVRGAGRRSTPTR